MAEDKKKSLILTTPRLVAKFPKLIEPDFGNKDYPKPAGEFSLKGIAKADDAVIQAFLEKLAPLYQQALDSAEEEFGKLKVETRKKLKTTAPNPLYTTLYDPDTEEETGEIEFKFAMTHSGVSKKTNKTWRRYPALFDAAGRPMVVRDKFGKTLSGAPAIWGGSILKVSFEPSPYFIPGTGACGLKLKLAAVQVIDLVSGGQRSASGYGFESEDGYAAEDYSGHDEEPTGEPATGDNSEGSDGSKSSRTVDF